jgi:hypothetical protein
MEDGRMVKKLTNWKPFEKRLVGRPKNRWIYGIIEVMEGLKVKNWKELIRNRKEWNKLVEKPKPTPCFSAEEEEEEEEEEEKEEVRFVENNYRWFLKRVGG